MIASARLIDEFLAAWDVREHHEVVVRADPARTYATLRDLDLARPLLVRALFALRSLPALARGTPGLPGRLTLEDALRMGFVVLGEKPGEELVLGAAGQPWRLGGGGAPRVGPASFAAFAEPGYAKMAVDFRVEPTTDGRTLLSTETRVRCTDETARRSFRRYWRVVGPFSALIRRRWLALAKAEAEALA